MFASCCGWFCEDSADESAESERRHQSYTNSAFSTQPSSPPEPTCKACGGGFDTPAKKHLCVDCKKHYCSRCSAQLEPRPRLCHTCQRFYGNLLERAELMKLKVKELRDYLHLHEVSTHLCREKEELVELVLGQQPSPSTESSLETPDTIPTSVTSDLSEQTPNTPTLIPDPPTPTPEPPAAQPEALPLPAETAPEEEDTQDEDQIWDPEEAPVPGRRASLSDLSSVDDIEALSVRQLKEILARNFVNYKGCCEKWELMERVTRLYQDQQNLLESGGGGGAASPEENLLWAHGHLHQVWQEDERMSHLQTVRRPSCPRLPIISEPNQPDRRTDCLQSNKWKSS
ncbi:E3 ubiquitin-protein ligase rififylin [Xyrichtys novacula]|uniref:RING-type E3 ubiquitin transferase n=1 Tax=Xyrichtys novacula TaxID=13765 RepID=A0AAV1FZ32_XYRNO|nr:E3 ubiquitin-protein ligase rififylin [Xyrichtys novacula]